MLELVDWRKGHFEGRRGPAGKDGSAWPTSKNCPAVRVTAGRYYTPPSGTDVAAGAEGEHLGVLIEVGGDVPGRHLVRGQPLRRGDEVAGGLEPRDAVLAAGGGVAVEVDADGHTRAIRAVAGERRAVRQHAIDVHFLCDVAEAVGQGDVGDERTAGVGRAHRRQSAVRFGRAEFGVCKSFER